ncbi:MAG: hypothetical protein Ct9H300mP1_21750 [Planctomycetaceae bacterium]|nr:MAG: hypothetical protein Ct9H300mP1_21750 [Planctomycetaceae bacterium]
MGGVLKGAPGVKEVPARHSRRLTEAVSQFPILASFRSELARSMSSF